MAGRRRVTIVVHGQVQGVGFRHFIWRLARQLRLDGEVRNRADGAVAIQAAGEPAAVGMLIEAARRGPANAEVQELEVREDEGPEPELGFRVTA